MLLGHWRQPVAQAEAIAPPNLSRPNHSRTLKITLTPIAISSLTTLVDDKTMHMLYDSESFVVVHMLTEHPSTSPVSTAGGASAEALLPRHGFEIVDKSSGKEVYLDGAWAELFQQEVNTWETEGTSQEDIEATLSKYAELAQNPVILH